MDNFVGSTSSAVSPFFDNAQWMANNNATAIQNLYSALVTGLQGRADAVGSNIAASAAQRGILRPTLNSGIQDQLNQALLSSQAQIGVNRGKSISGIRGQQTETEAQRLSSIYDMAGQTLGAAINREETELQERAIRDKMQQDTAETDLEIKIAEQEAARRRAAEAAAAARQATPSGADHVNQLYDAFSQIAGRDGYVNPNDYNRARQAWKEMGLPLRSFDKSFSTFVNPAHQRSGRSDLVRYAGQKVKGR